MIVATIELGMMLLSMRTVYVLPFSSLSTLIAPFHSFSYNTPPSPSSQTTSRGVDWP